ncbi:Alkyl hydroperoxide reductase [Balamuthia mandrillaris]
MSSSSQHTAVTSSLKASIEGFLNSISLPPEVSKVVQDAIQAVQQHNGEQGKGLPVGEKAPDFTLLDQTGKPIALSSALREGPVVLTFYRGSWCPFCNLQLRAYSQHLPSWRERFGAQLIAVTPEAADPSDKASASASASSSEETSFPVLTDADQTVIVDYRLQFTPIESYLALIKNAFALDLAQRNADRSNNLPVPGTFVIDREGVIRARFVDPNYMTRMEPSVITEALERISASSSS